MVRVLILILFLNGMLFSQEAYAAETLKVLFIGNSYTDSNNLPKLIVDIAVSAKEPKYFEGYKITKGGATLKDHWDNPEVRQKISERKWDYVVLQEQSDRPIREYNFMYNYVKRFNAEIKKNGAKTVLFLTWAKKNRKSDQKYLNKAFFKIQRKLKDIMVVPVGVAWQKVRRKYPKLLLHQQDGSHPTKIGSYLAACVFYSAFYHNSPVGFAHPLTVASHRKKESETVTAEELAFIQQTSFDVVNSL